MAKILIIEDDESIRKALLTILTKQSYIIVEAPDGEEGLYLIESENPDLVVLDVMMPYMNGFEVITECRRKGIRTPIILLTSRNQKEDKIRGFDLGADDYITKPFEPEVLLALIRRKLTLPKNQEFSFGNFIYHKNEHLLFQNEKNIPLNTKEYLCLEYLLSRPNQIVTRESLLIHAWGHDYEGTDRTVDNVIVSLRKKTAPSYIQSIRGMGYRFMTKP